MEMLHELCEIIMREIEECNDKIRDAGGKLTAGDVDYLDKLTHTLKSIKTTMAMMEGDSWYSGEGGSGGGGGNSNRSYRGSGNSNRSYRSNSYARGRGRNARRDSMGRYARESGYSYAEGMEDIIEDIRGMMDDLPEEKRSKVERLVNELEK